MNFYECESVKGNYFSHVPISKFIVWQYNYFLAYFQSNKVSWCCMTHCSYNGKYFYISFLNWHRDICIYYIYICHVLIYICICTYIAHSSTFSWIEKVGTISEKSLMIYNLYMTLNITSRVVLNAYTRSIASSFIIASTISAIRFYDYTIRRGVACKSFVEFKFKDRCFSDLNILFILQTR